MEKVHRVNRVENSLTPKELERMLPEINLIGDDDIRDETARTFLDWCPDYFWEIPSSGSGKYHPPDERGEYGNLLHTKRVFLAYEQLARSYTEQHLITADEYHCGQAAALLHDMFKFGWPSEQNDVTVSEHDVIAANVVLHKTDLPNKVSEAIATHAGAWGEGPSPETALQQLLHMADMTVTPSHYYSDVFEPCEELRELGVGGVDIHE